MRVVRPLPLPSRGWLCAAAGSGSPRLAPPPQPSPARSRSTVAGHRREGDISSSLLQPGGESCPSPGMGAAVVPSSRGENR